MLDKTNLIYLSYKTILGSMDLKTTYTLLFAMSIFSLSFGQAGIINGTVNVDNNKQEFATISISTDPIQVASTNSKGYFDVDTFPFDI